MEKTCSCIYHRLPHFKGKRLFHHEQSHPMKAINYNGTKVVSRDALLSHMRCWNYTDGDLKIKDKFKVVLWKS